MSPASMPAVSSFADYDPIHDDVQRWRPWVEALAAAHAQPGEALRAMDGGTVMVVLLGTRAAFKLYPPFLQDHFEFERAALQALQQAPALPAPVPRLLASGDEQGWPWLLMTQLSGEVLTPLWGDLAEPDKCALLRHIGQVMAAVHALPHAAVQALQPHALHGGDWAAFIAHQRAHCQQRQQRTRLPEHLLAQVEAFVAGPVPMPAPEQRVMLTGEYTPMNLLIAPAAPSRLSGMFDFGDGLVGACEMDWLGPLVFLAAGHKPRVDALFEGYGGPTFAEWRLPALRLLLLHRYSGLRGQIKLPGWQDAGSFEELAWRLWPEA